MSLLSRALSSLILASAAMGSSHAGPEMSRISSTAQPGAHVGAAKVSDPAPTDYPDEMKVELGTLAAADHWPFGSERRVGQEYSKYLDGLTEPLGKSNLPRDWALAYQISSHRTADHVDAALREQKSLLDKASLAAPNDRLVQWIQANPEHASSINGDPVPSDGGSISALDEKNGAAWIPALNAAWDAKDISKTDDALARIASAERFDDYYVESLEAWRDVVKRHSQLSANLIKGTGSTTDDEEKSAALTIRLANEMPKLWIAPLLDTCTRKDHPEADEKRFENCGKAGRLMLNHATTLDLQLMGFVLLRESTTATAADVETLRTLKWQLQQRARITPLSMNDRAVLRRYLADMIAAGNEGAALQRMLVRAGTPLRPPTNWQPSESRPAPAPEDMH